MEPKPGQAPVSAPVEPVVAPATPPVPPPVAAPALSEKPALSVEDYIKMLADVRKEAADHRVKAKEAQDKLDAANLEKLTVEERTVAELKKLREETLPALEKANRQLTVQVAAVALNIVDPDAAAKLVDWDAITSGTSIEDALKALVIEKPYLLRPAQAAVLPSAAPIIPASTSSPAASTTASSPLSYTKESLSKMSHDEYAANRDSILQALREKRVS
jgi:hypothetical protein